MSKKLKYVFCVFFLIIGSAYWLGSNFDYGFSWRMLLASIASLFISVIIGVLLICDLV